MADRVTTDHRAEVALAWRRWLEADEVFQAELVRVYGKEAGDMRYRSTWTDARLTAAHAEFRRLGEEYKALAGWPSTSLGDPAMEAVR